MLTAVVAETLASYRVDYERYVQRQMARKGIVVKPLDPDPRVILAPDSGETLWIARREKALDTPPDRSRSLHLRPSDPWKSRQATRPERRLPIVQ